MIARPPIGVGKEFLDALAAQDFERLAGCFAPDVDFHAVVPGVGSYREADTAEGTTNQFRKWYASLDPFAVLESSVTPIVDKLCITYRLATFDDGGWQIVQQTAYARIGERGIEKFDVACSGWMAVDADPRPD